MSLLWNSSTAGTICRINGKQPPYEYDSQSRKIPMSKAGDDMTTREFIQAADSHPLILVAAFVLPPLPAWVYGRFHGKDRGDVTP